MPGKLASASSVPPGHALWEDVGARPSATPRRAGVTKGPTGTGRLPSTGRSGGPREGPDAEA